MKYFLFISLLCLSLYGYAADFSTPLLDRCITKKVQELSQAPIELKKIESITYAVQACITKEVSLQELDCFLNRKDCTEFFTALSQDLNWYVMSTDEKQVLSDLQILLSAKLYCYYLENCKQMMLQKAAKNYEGLQYWKHEKFYQKKLWYRPLVTASQYAVHIDEHIASLQQTAEKIYYFLGVITRNQEVMLQADGVQAVQEYLQQAMAVHHDFAHRSYGVVATEEMYLFLKNVIHQAYMLSLQISDVHAKHQLPSYLERSWKKYTASAAGLAVIGLIGMRYKRELIDIPQHFFDEHIKGPLERNIQTFTSIANGPKLDTEQDERLLAASRQACLTAEQLEHMSPEEQVDLIKRQDTMILATAKINFNTLVYDSSNPVSGISSQYQAFQRYIYENSINIKTQTNQILKDVHMILGLTALIPAMSLAAVIGGSLFASKTLYASAAHQQMRMCVYALDRFINELLHEQLTLQDSGQLYFLTENLRSQISILTLDEQEMMQHDIAALQNSKLDCVQKYHVIERMYKTYPCLAAR